MRPENAWSAAKAKTMPRSETPFRGHSGVHLRPIQAPVLKTRREPNARPAAPTRGQAPRRPSFINSLRKHGSDSPRSRAGRASRSWTFRAHPGFEPSQATPEKPRFRPSPTRVRRVHAADFSWIRDKDSHHCENLAGRYCRFEGQIAPCQWTCSVMRSDPTNPPDPGRLGTQALASVRPVWQPRTSSGNEGPILESISSCRHRDRSEHIAPVPPSSGL
jgi:hypothetical protein